MSRRILPITTALPVFLLAAAGILAGAGSSAADPNCPMQTATQSATQSESDACVFDLAVQTIALSGAQVVAAGASDAGTAPAPATPECPMAAAHASCTAPCPSDAAGPKITLPKGMHCSILEVPGGVDFIFTGKGVVKFASNCGTNWRRTCGCCGDTMSCVANDQMVVLAFRSQKDHGCAETQLRKALGQAAGEDENPSTPRG